MLRRDIFFFLYLSTIVLQFIADYIYENLVIQYFSMFELVLLFTSWGITSFLYLFFPNNKFIKWCNEWVEVYKVKED